MKEIIKKNVSHNDSSKCCGCGVCVNICPQNAIDYSENKYGFIHPLVNQEKCVNCGACIRLCPLISTPLLHDPIIAYAAMSKNDQLRYTSSSGGLFGIFAERVLTDGGVVYGCTIDQDFKVHHVRIDHINDLKLIQKSKYVQSFMRDVYKDAIKELSQHKTVLFSGTPCIIAAARNAIGDKKNIIYIDVVCHGVPSQKLFDDYIHFLNNREGVQSYQFRTKVPGDKGMLWYHSYVNGKGKQIIENWPEDSYNYYYMSGYTCRDSCYDCIFARRERTGDITLCDYWGWDHFHTEFNLNDSVSGLIVNTEKGQEIVNSCSKGIIMYPTKYENIIANNGNLKSSINEPKDRKEILDFWLKNGYAALDSRFKSDHRVQIIKNKLYRKTPFFIRALYDKLLK